MAHAAQLPFDNLEGDTRPDLVTYGLSVIFATLTFLGLTMVLSASMIVSLQETGSPMAVFLHQAVFVVLGSIGAVVAARMPARFWKRVSVPVLVVAVILQALVVLTPLGTEHQGNRSWLALGPLSFQPSELSKLGLVLAGASALSASYPRLARPGPALVPFVFPAALSVLGLILAGHDLGTGLVVCMIVVVMLFAAGVQLGWFSVSLGLAGAVIAAVAASKSSRVERVAIWLDPSKCVPETDLYYGVCRQPMHGRFALAEGGWAGVGLGASREKWGWLSEPYNDFIFAIVGEELGVIGATLIILLFLAMAWLGMQIATRTDDLFIKLAATGIVAWLFCQMLVNVGAVVGLTPVIGVPLPFVSAGGSAAVSSMLAAGVLLSLARATAPRGDRR